MGPEDDGRYCRKVAGGGWGTGRSPGQLCGRMGSVFGGAFTDLVLRQAQDEVYERLGLPIPMPPTRTIPLDLMVSLSNHGAAATVLPASSFDKLRMRSARDRVCRL